jgi:hypothetical protein
MAATWFESIIVVGAVLVVFLGFGVKFANFSGQSEARADTC